MKRRLQLLFLAMVMILATVIPALAKETKKISEDDKIKYLVDKKIVEGVGDGDLKLDAPIKRSELVKIIVYALGNEDKAKELNGKDMPFTDVEKDYWANGVIAVSKDLAMDNGIKLINGYPNGEFRPEDNILASEVITVLVKMAKNDLTEEVIKNAKWPTDFVNWAKEDGILLDSYNLGEEDLAQPLKRDIVFKMLYNAMDIMNKEEDPGRKVVEAKEILKNYLDSLKLEVLEDEGIALAKNEKAIEEFKAEVEKAKTLLEKDNKDITPEELEYIEKFPTYMKDDKRVKGDLRKFARKILVDFEIPGEKTAINPHTDKKYLEITGPGAEFTVKSAVKDLEQKGSRKLYMNYVTGEVFDAAEVDASSGATPKYKKQSVPEEFYTVTDNKDGSYTIKIKELPEDTKILKVIIKVEVGFQTNVENADLVFVKAVEK